MSRSDKCLEMKWPNVTKEMLYEDLFAGESIAEGGDNLLGQEVEYQTEGDTDGQGWQSSPEEGQEHQCQAESNQDGDKAGEGCVPITVAAGFPYQNAVEDKISQT